MGAVFSLMICSWGCTPTPTETADSQNPPEATTQVTPAPDRNAPTTSGQSTGGLATPTPTAPQPVEPVVNPDPVPENQPNEPEPAPPTPRPEPSPDVSKPEPPPKPDPQPTPSAQPSLKAGFAIGDLAPDIHGEDLDNVAFSLSDYRGKVVVLDFWGDW